MTANIPRYGAATMGTAKDALEFGGTGIALMNHMVIRTKGGIHYGTLSIIV